MPELIYYINGNWVPLKSAKIPITDAGFQLGDGLFETLRFDNKKIFSAQKHLERLNKGLKFVHIDLNINNENIISLMNQLINKNNLSSGLLRLMVTRGNLEGEPWTFKGTPNLYISIRNLTKEPTLPVKVVFFAENKYPIIRFNPAIKSLNYIGNMLAKKDAEKLSAYEPVFYNNSGYITECAIRNIFFIRGNALITPQIKLGVLEGVMRNSIINIAQKLNLDVFEEKIKFKSINNMDEAFISSTGIGLYPCYWEGWKSNFTITKNIKNILDAIISKTSS
tara:strand:- start:297 stop:1136 length:840 start_codon:yes stop_codon:yes gene_type:complete